MESWGSGAKRIIDACREQGLEEPIWQWDGGFITVIFKRPNPTPNMTSAENDIKSNDKENDLKASDYDKELQQRNLSEIQLHILDLISKQPSITFKELAISLSLSISALRNQRKQMEKKGVFLCRKGATKKGIWEINLSHK